MPTQVIESDLFQEKQSGGCTWKGWKGWRVLVRWDRHGGRVKRREGFMQGSATTMPVSCRLSSRKTSCWSSFRAHVAITGKEGRTPYINTTIPCQHFQGPAHSQSAIDHTAQRKWKTTEVMHSITLYNGYAYMCVCTHTRESTLSLICIKEPNDIWNLHEF